MTNNRHKISQLLFWTCAFSAYCGNYSIVTASTGDDSNVATVADSSTKYFFNKRRDPREIGVHNTSDTFYVLVDDLFNPSFRIFDGTSGRITIPSRTPISFRCAVCVKRKTLSNTSGSDDTIQMTLGQIPDTYSNQLVIHTDEYKCTILSYSIPYGLYHNNESRWLTCVIYTRSSNIYRYIHVYIDIENRDKAHFIYNDLFRIPKSAKYLACKRPNNESEIYEGNYIFFWGKLVETQSNLCPMDKSEEDFPEEIAAGQFANRTKYKIIPILESGLYLPVINQIQVTDINENIFSNKIICIRYGYVTRSKKKQSIRVIVWYLDKNAPNIVSVPIKANAPCVYPLMRYSGKHPSLLIHTQERIVYTITLNNILTITGYCIVVFLCAVIIIAYISANRTTLFLCTSGRSNRRHSNYKQDFRRVLNAENIQDC